MVMSWVVIDDVFVCRCRDMCGGRVERRLRKMWLETIFTKSQQSPIDVLLFLDVFSVFFDDGGRRRAWFQNFRR